MDKDKNLEKDIMDMVSRVFSEKEEAAQKQAMQEALTESATTIEELTTNLEALQAELASAKETSGEEIAEKDSKIGALTEELEAAQKKVEDMEAELATVKESMENMEKDQMAEARMKELEEAKVVASADVEGQTSKVREMTEEEFAAYKSERVELRAAVEKELADAQSATPQEPAQADDPEENASEEEDNGEETEENASEEEEEVVTPPANIGPGQAMASAMNLETNPSDDVAKKYQDMGKAMAAMMKPATADK